MSVSTTTFLVYIFSSSPFFHGNVPRHAVYEAWRPRSSISLENSLSQIPDPFDPAICLLFVYVPMIVCLACEQRAHTIAFGGVIWSEGYGK